MMLIDQNMSLCFCLLMEIKQQFLFFFRLQLGHQRNPRSVVVGSSVEEFESIVVVDSGKRLSARVADSCGVFSGSV